MLQSVSLELQTVGPSALPASTAGLDLTSVTSVTPDPEQVDSADQVAHVPLLATSSGSPLQYQTPTRGGATS